jgi:hypothetical protein
LPSRSAQSFDKAGWPAAVVAGFDSPQSVDEPLRVHLARAKEAGRGREAGGVVFLRFARPVPGHNRARVVIWFVRDIEQPSPPISTTRWRRCCRPCSPTSSTDARFPDATCAADRRADGPAPTDSEAPIRVAALLQRLQELGWTDRRNVRIGYRLGDSNTKNTVAAALVALAPDILVVNGTSGLQALQQATRTIPRIRECNRSGRPGLHYQPGASRW